VRKVCKKQRNRRERDSTEGTVDDSERKKRRGRKGKGGREKRNNFGAMKKKPTASASGGVCGVGARPFSPLPDKHRFAYDRHFAGSII